MAQRIMMEQLQSDKARIRDLLSPPATNRRHLQIAQQALHRVISDELTARQREMLVMYYFEQKRGFQIAQELGVNPSTVTRTLRRAEQRIRKSMQFYFDYRNANLEDDD